MNLTEHITPGGPLLEVLRRAEASLRDEPYEFMDWTRCTCGHVYTATTGRTATTDQEVQMSRNVTFLQVVRYILNATSELTEGHKRPVDELSWRTMQWAKGDEPSESDILAAALQLIRTAIAKCEAEQLAAMHAVADEAQRVVSLVGVPESVLA